MKNENNEKMEDLSKALIEDGFTSLIESETLRQIIIDSTSAIISGSAAPILGAILGAAAPRVNGVFLSYKQHRFERNITGMVKNLSEKVDNLESNYSKLDDNVKELYQTQGVEMLLDNIIDERQEEKVKLNVNGFVSLMTNEANENIMQYFFDTLADLTILDIDTLRMYSMESDHDWKKLQNKYSIDDERLVLVKEKLVHYGLLIRKNDQIRDKNIDEIVVYLQKIDSESKKSKPQKVKMPSAIKKINHFDSYRITRLGNSFLNSIGG